MIEMTLLPFTNSKIFSQYILYKRTQNFTFDHTLLRLLYSCFESVTHNVIDTSR